MPMSSPRLKAPAAVVTKRESREGPGFSRNQSSLNGWDNFGLQGRLHCPRGVGLRLPLPAPGWTNFTCRDPVRSLHEDSGLLGGVQRSHFGPLSAFRPQQTRRGCSIVVGLPRGEKKVEGKKHTAARQSPHFAAFLVAAHVLHDVQYFRPKACF